MRLRNLLFIGVGIIAGFAAPALADLTYTQGSGTTIFDFVCFTTKHCSAHVPVNSAGTEIATSGNPIRTDPTGTTTQPVSAVSLPTHGVTVASGGIASGGVASGAMVDLGSQADAACGTGTGNCSLIALTKYSNATSPVLGAGSAIIGALVANQSVNTAQINGVTPLMGNGQTGTGAQRMTLSQDGASAAINVSSATDTQIVPLSGSTVIYVTSFDVVAGGTGNITFEYGTGSNCATGKTALTGAYPLTAQAGIAKGSGVGTILKVPAGNALCVLTSAAVQMSGSVSYIQF